MDSGLRRNDEPERFLKAQRYFAKASAFDLIRLPENNCRCGTAFLVLRGHNNILAG
jgi:hypothetical protein